MIQRNITSIYRPVHSNLSHAQGDVKINSKQSEPNGIIPGSQILRRGALQFRRMFWSLNIDIEI